MLSKENYVRYTAFSCIFLLQMVDRVSLVLRTWVYVEHDISSYLFETRKYFSELSWLAIELLRSCNFNMQVYKNYKCRRWRKLSIKMSEPETMFKLIKFCRQLCCSLSLFKINDKLFSYIFISHRAWLLQTSMNTCLHTWIYIPESN